MTNKRYKVGVIGANLLQGKDLIRELLNRNFPYSFIRGISYNDDKKSIYVDDFQFSLTKLTLDSLKDLEVVFIILDNVDIDEYLNYLKESNKCCVIINNLLNNNINIDSYSDNKNIFVCPLASSISLFKILDNFDIERIEVQGFHSAIEHGDIGIQELENQYVDYFSFRPLIATSFPSLNSRHIPLAFNIIPFNLGYDINFKEQVYKLINKDFEFMTCDYYIPSLYSSAMHLKIICKNADEVLNKIKNNKELIINETECPTLLDSEGKNKIYVGNLNKLDNTICLFATFDYLKINSIVAVKFMERRLKDD